MTTTTSEPQRSGPGVEPAIGMVNRFARWHTGDPIVDHDPPVPMNEEMFANYSEGGRFRGQWMNGQVDIYASPVPAKQPAPVDAQCKGAPCGMDLNDRSKWYERSDNYNGWFRDPFNVPKDALGVDGAFYCSPACRDAAKAKAPTCADRREGTPCELAPGHDGAHRSGSWSWQRNPTTFERTDQQPAPQPAPWKCSMGDGCKTPRAPRHLNSRLPNLSGGTCVACADDMIGQMMIRHDTHRTVEAPSLPAAPLLPGTAHALAVAGARTWRRPTSYVPLDLGFDDE